MGNTKRTVSLSLSDIALRKLELFRDRLGISRSGVVEILVRERDPVLSEKNPEELS